MSEPWPLRTSSEFRTNLLFSFHRPVKSDHWSAKVLRRLIPEGNEHSHHHCAQYPPVCVRSVDGYQGVCMVSIPCVLFESLCIFTQDVSAHTGLGLPYVNIPPPAFSAASEGVDTVPSGSRLTALDYINVNFAPTGCLLIMAIGRLQCCLDPIELAGELSWFVLILSPIRLEEPIRISCAGFLEVSFFLILIIMRWRVISRSHSLCFAVFLLAAFYASHHLSAPSSSSCAWNTGWKGHG